MKFIIKSECEIITEIPENSNTNHASCQERKELTVNNNCFENFNETSYVEKCSFYIEVRPDGLHWLSHCFSRVFSLPVSVCWESSPTSSPSSSSLAITSPPPSPTSSAASPSSTPFYWWSFWWTPGWRDWRWTWSGTPTSYRWFTPSRSAFPTFLYLMTSLWSDQDISAHDHHRLHLHGGGHLH